MTCRTTLDRGGGQLVIGALMFLMANGAGYAGFLMGLGIRRMKLLGRVALDDEFSIG